MPARKKSAHATIEAATITPQRNPTENPLVFISHDSLTLISPKRSAICSPMPAAEFSSHSAHRTKRVPPVLNMALNGTAPSCRNWMMPPMSSPFSPLAA
jgi:hypothetical protein